MGRFGLSSDAMLWSRPDSRVRPLISKDPLRVLFVFLAVFGTGLLPRQPVWWSVIPSLLVPLAFVALSRVEWKQVRDRVLAVVPFGFLAIMFLPWTGGGPHMHLWGLSFSRPGLLLAAGISVKLASIALWLAYLAGTTPVPRLLSALRVLRVPGPLVDILSATLRFLAVFSREVKTMLLSCRLRSSPMAESRVPWGLRLRRTLSRLASLLAGLLIRVLKRSERCSQALAARTSGPGGAPAEEPGLGIEIQGLSFRYPGGKANALTGVSLAIPGRSRIAILGANGAGKTTLLLHLNGVHLPQSGRVSVGGIEVAGPHLARIRRLVGMVFQNPDDQVFAATVAEDVRYGPEQAGWDEETIEKVVSDSLKAVGLAAERETPPFSLSQGQRKRAAIAGVLACGAEVLVLDEPMASLDPAGKDEIHVLLNDLHAAGKTLVVATHDVDFAAGWADVVILMDRGQVVAVGGPGLLVNEAAMNVAGLSLPLVSRPFERLRPLVKSRDLGLERLPANIGEAFAWLKRHFAPDRATGTPGEPVVSLKKKDA